jgi:hypothetical protein
MKTKINGRGKAIVLHVFFVLAVICQARATVVNWNSIEVNDVEYYVQTDKLTYELSEEVEMLYRITNLSQESITFTLPHHPVWNFWAEASGQCIWTGMYSKLAIVTSLTIGAGESVEFPDFNPPFTWDLRDDNDILVQPGTYFIIGGIDHPQGIYDYTKVPVQIEIVPEPASICFLSIGLTFLSFFLKRKI